MSTLEAFLEQRLAEINLSQDRLHDAVVSLEQERNAVGIALMKIRLSTPQNAMPGGAPEPGSVDKTKAPGESIIYKEPRTDDPGVGPAPWLDEEAELTEALKS